MHTIYRRRDAWSASALPVLLLIALTVWWVPSAEAATSVSLEGPSRVVRGDTVALKGRVEGRRAADLTLQSKASRTSAWQVVSKAASARGTFRFTTTPTTTTWFRVVAVRNGTRVTSPTVKVVVAEPVFRWFSLYELGADDGDPDGFGMDGSIYAGDWHGEYGYDGYVGEVGSLDTGDWASFTLSGQCNRMTGAIGASGYEAMARVEMEDGAGTSLLARDFGDEQWQRLDLDVTGIRTLRLDLAHLGGRRLTAYLLGALVHCDSRFGARPKDGPTHRWRALHDLGTVDGDPDGWATDGSIYSGDWHDQYGYDGYIAEVSDEDVEDWAEFAVPRGCLSFNAALGWVYRGSGQVRLSDQDGRILYRRDLGGDQWRQVDLDLDDVTILRIDAISQTSGDADVVLLGGRFYCRR